MRSTNLRMETNLNSLLKDKLDELQVLEEEYELCKQVRFMHNRDLAHAHVFSQYNISMCCYINMHIIIIILRKFNS